MISLAERVKTLLESACPAVWYFYPQSWIRLPCVSWRESGNREFAQADGQEHLAELKYTVDVWAKSPAEMAELSAAVDGRLRSVRLKREFSQDLFESGIYHRTMRYRCVADAEGRIYQ